MIRLTLDKSVATSAIDGIEDRRTAAATQTMHACRQQGCVIRKVLHHLAAAIEAHHKSLVEIGTQGVLQETNRRLLFEVKPAAN